MRHDAKCVGIGCEREATRYLMFYDHRDCLLSRGEVLLIPVCEKHLTPVNENLTEVHFQCMGWDVEAKAVADLFALEYTVS